jgi:phosphomannomutase
MSTNGLIISVSGIRGLIGSSLTPAATLAFAQALGASTLGGKIVLSRDGRPSGLMLRHAVLAGLIAAGCEVQDLGVAPTATVGIAVKSLGAVGGIQITASHNPAPWNGLKLFGADGRILSASKGRDIQHLFEAGQGRLVAHQELGSSQDYHKALELHRDRVLHSVDVAQIQAAHPHAYLDANGGAGGPLGRMLLAAFGVQTHEQGCFADGNFVHEPEPTAENLQEVCPRVREAGADIGFALDPDADRLALIDEQGRFIGEELTLALAVRFRLAQERGPVVINMSTSRVIEDICNSFSCPCLRSAVGEANVADRMIATGAVIGGEGNGGVIDPRIGYVRDPFIGMGLILNLMAQTGMKLSELVAELPPYFIVKDKYTVPPEQLPALYQALQARWPEAQINTVDGLRLDWKDRWVHVRPSNTEPIVRVIAEARSKELGRRLCQEVGGLLRG